MIKIKSFEELIAQTVVSGAVAWLKTKLWIDFDVTFDDKLIYMAYYELKEFCVRKNIVEFVDQDLLIEILVEIIKIVEIETEEKLLEDPEYVKKILKERAWLWNTYLLFRDFVTKDNVKAVADSPVTKALDGYMNSVMIKNPELLDYKVHRDVDFAVQDYKDLTGDTGEIKIEPIFSEELEGETPLGGFLELNAPYETD